MELKRMWLFHGCDPSLTFLTVKRNSGDPGKESRQRVGATATAGPGPADVDESMLSALLAATHDAAMECYRLGTIPGQKPEGRRESLSQASELVHSCAVLMEAIGRHRGPDWKWAAMTG